MHALLDFEMMRSRNSPRRKSQPHQKLFQKNKKKKKIQHHQKKYHIVALNKGISSR